MGRKPSGRSRLSFEVERDFLQRVEEAAASRGQTIRALCEQAIIQSLVEPTFTFFSPEFRSLEPLPQFLKGCREMVMIGANLSARWSDDQELQTFLVEQITTNRVPMTFVIIDPELDSSSEEKHRLHFKDIQSFYWDTDLKADSAKSMKALTTLCQAAREARVPIRVFGMPFSPGCGITLVDPNRDSAKAVVSYYLDIPPQRIRPTMQYRANTPEGKAACSAFFDYYVKCSQHSRLVLYSLSP